MGRLLALQAKPLLQKGVRAIQELLDPQLRHTPRSTSQVLRLIQAAHACLNSEESQRPPMDDVVAILRGEEVPSLLSRKSSAFQGNGCMIDFYSQLQQSKTDMNGHLALAMLGVPDFEDDDHFFCRWDSRTKGTRRFPPRFSSSIIRSNSCSENRTEKDCW